MTPHPDPLQPFTREMFFSMTQEQIFDFWRAKQRALRDRGEPHFERAVDAITGKVYATINDPLFETEE